LETDPPENWLASAAQPGWHIGFDPMHLPPVWFDRFAVALVGKGAELAPLSDNPVDAIWPDQPARPMAPATPFPLQFAGQTVAGKCADLKGYMAQRQADFLVETQPDNIAWLLNVRGADVLHNPTVQSFLMVAASGAVTWFVEPGKLDADVMDHLPDDVGIERPEGFIAELERQIGAGKRVLFDPDFSPVAVRFAVERAGAVPVAEPGWLTRTKARKNPTELEGLRAAHIEDGVAWVEFSAWLAEAVPVRAGRGDPVTEAEAAARIAAFRAARPGYCDESFHAISASGGNAAMCHYIPEAGRDAPILPDLPYLLDSGAQFETGTTDATRCFNFGARPQGYDRAYTAVFKAFHALVSLRFPKGTRGHHIDAICRRPLWDAGLDYDHGTGHGIGHRLSVHEHPLRIGRKVNDVDLMEGAVMTIEPGCYVENQFGIRIENTVEIVEGADGFLAFRSLTLAPIQTDMLIRENLSLAEEDWLADYHAKVKRQLDPFLSDRARQWLHSDSAGATGSAAA
ncbi:MAG: M24 family metallopeptidase, partial [Albidovulum sp.]|uniref:M24 family metallopeptidase n=1 Tax=Albidovulum sp. TaxID=1872424 RepID=UPI003CC31DC4